MKTCLICSRKKIKGNQRSHSNRATRRFWKINLQKYKVEIKNKKYQIILCTSCIRNLKHNKIKINTIYE